MNSTPPKQGIVLVAEPSIIGDFSFNRSVILLSHHTTTGSVGFILNKALDMTLDELIPSIKIKFRLYNGGPVEQDNLYFIHQVPELIPDSIEIKHGIYWGGSFETIVELINTQVIKENDIKFFLGYSGWSPQQLEEELASDAWLIAENVNYSQLIAAKDAVFWKKEIQKIGGDYLIWQNAPENPSYN